MKYSVLILDDEEPARDLLSNYVQKIEELEITAIHNNALDAKKTIQQRKIDILLSDIQMDDLTGIDLVKMLKNPPVVIFTTAYSEYALESFELEVADYLVKPVSFQRFSKSIDKAIELIQFKNLKLAKPISPSQENKFSDFFFVKTNRKMVKVKYAEIIHVESYGEYVKIHTKDDVILALQRTSFMEDMLPEDDFIRIHRSHIINVNHILEIDGNSVVMEGKNTLVVSKRMKEKFIKVITEKGVI